MKVQEPKNSSSSSWWHWYPGFKEDVCSGWKFTGNPHCQRGIKALSWEGICHMKTSHCKQKIEGSIFKTAVPEKDKIDLGHRRTPQTPVQPGLQNRWHVLVHIKRVYKHDLAKIWSIQAQRASKLQHLIFFLFPPSAQPHVCESGETRSSLKVILDWHSAALWVQSIDI